MRPTEGPRQWGGEAGREMDGPYVYIVRRLLR